MIAMEAHLWRVCLTIIYMCVSAIGVGIICLSSELCMNNTHWIGKQYIQHTIIFIDIRQYIQFRPIRIGESMYLYTC